MSLTAYSVPDPAWGLNHIILPNGLKVILARNNGYPLVSLQMFIRSGSSAEGPNEEGFAHLIEHLVFKNTQNCPDGSLMEAASRLGALLNAYTEFDSTCFYLTCAASLLAPALSLLAEPVYRAIFRQPDLEAERDVVLEECKQYKNDPEDHFLEQIPTAYFPHNPYARPIIGRPKPVAGAELPALLNYYRKHYTPANAFLVISGDFGSDIQEIVQKELGDWQGTAPVIPVYNDDLYPHKNRHVFIKFPAQVDLLAYALPEPAERHPQSLALSLGGKALAQGKSSRLYRRLCLEEGLADHVRIHSLCGVHNGMSIFQIMPRSGASIKDIDRIFVEELLRYLATGPTNEEVERLKNETLHSWRYSFEYVEGLGQYLGAEEIIGSYDYWLRYPADVAALTREAVQTALADWYNPARLYSFHKGKARILGTPVVNTTRPVVAKPEHAEKFNLSLRQVYHRQPGKPTLGVSICMPVSHLQEQPGERGVNLVASSLLLYGTKQMEYRAFLEHCQRHGLHLNVSQNSENTTLRAKCFPDQLEETLRLMSQCLATPALKAEHFRHIKKTLLSNLDRLNDYPLSLAHDRFKKLLLGASSPLVRREGEREDIKRLSLAQVKHWQQTYFAKATGTICLAGDADPAEFFRLADQFIITGDGPKTSPVYIPQLPAPRETLIENTGQDQAIIHLGGFACNANQMRENTAFNLLAQVVGGDINSRLFDELREKRGWAYSVGCEFNSLRGVGWFYAYAVTDRKNARPALALMEEVLLNTARNGVTKRELDTARRYLVGMKLQDEESVAAQAHMVAALHTLGYSYEYYLKRRERLEKASLATLNRVAATYFTPERFFRYIMT